MTKITMSIKIDVSKIDKARLYKGAKGTYLDAVLLYNDEDDQYGNNGMIIQSIPKEERDAGNKGNILGNAKSFGAKANTQSESNVVNNSDSMPDDLPF